MSKDGERFEVSGELIRRRFKTKAGAERYLSRLREAMGPAADAIWMSIDLIYLTRWDCPMARLAAANQTIIMSVRSGFCGLWWA